MSEQDQNNPAQAAADRSMNRATRVLAIVILLSLCWYIAADRLTPYTSQARIEGFVVGIAPKVSGLVTAVDVKNNVAVAPGERLFSIDRSDYEIALTRANSELEKARNQVQAGDASVAVSRANLEAALANEEKNRKDFERLTRLYEQDPGTISKRRLEVSEAALEGAIAKVAGARADIQRAIESKGGDDDEANAFLLAAQSAVAKAELDLANTDVRAPLAGVITDLRTDVGQFAGTGNPVMTLVSTHDLWVNAAFTENNLGNIRAGTVVEILFDVLPGKVYSGRIRSIGLGISAGQPPPPGTLPTVQNNRDWLRQAQRFPVQVDIDFDNDEALIRSLRVGGQASVLAYGDAPAPLRWLGWLSIRVRSIFSYAY